MRLTLKGIPPPKKNSRMNFRTKSGKQVSLPSKSYTNWHKRVWTEVPVRPETVAKPLGVIVEYWLPDNKRRDLTNMTESVMDFLCDKGIIEDDCWQVAQWVICHAAGIDKERPRTEILICPSAKTLENLPSV